jgi:hypothetical protein
VDIIIKEFVEDFEEKEKSDREDDASNEEHTALDWEEAAAGQSLELAIGALAEAAAAHKGSVLQFLFHLVDFFFFHTAHHFFLSCFHGHHWFHFISSCFHHSWFITAFGHSWYIIL